MCLERALFLAELGEQIALPTSTTNMFLVQPNSGGALTRLAGYSLTGFTIEPTGLAYAPSTDPNDPPKDLLAHFGRRRGSGVLGRPRQSASQSSASSDRAQRPDRRGGLAYDLFDSDPNGHDGHLYIANGM